MKQLTMGEILAQVNELKRSGMSQKEIDKLPVYLGNDDELNGIHCGWYVDMLDADNPSGDSSNDQQYTIDLINEDRCNIKLEKGKAILIS